MSLSIQLQLRRGSFSLNANLRLGGDGITILFGPSGCGKTTLLRILAGLERVRDCEVRFGDALWQSATTFVPPHQRRVGYVFQEASLFRDRKVRQNLEYGYARTPPDKRKVTWADALDSCGVEPLLERWPDDLSGGERQRVAIARALLTSPRLLLMDEPLASLDQTSRDALLRALETLQRRLEVPVLYVTHDLNEAAQLGDGLILMEQGSIRAQGPVNEVLTALDQPLAKRPDAQSVVPGSVVRTDPEDGLIWLEALGQEIALVGQHADISEPVRLRIRAQDVSLTLEPHEHTSVLNVIPATVAGLESCEAGRAAVQLKAGSQKFLAHITQRSARLLDLAVGMSVFAQVKCTALSRFEE